MKTLKNDGSFEVIRVDKDVVNVIATAARTCYQSQDKANPESDSRLVKNIIERGHEAMLEFADMTVRFDDCSRGLTHELVRHRQASFAQESTRYVDESDFLVVVPPHKDENSTSLTNGCVRILLPTDIKDEYKPTYFSLTEWFDLNEQAYRSLRKCGWRPEDARQVLPTAIKAQIVIKANMREWRHIFKMRCDMYAHWEIRRVMIDLLCWCKDNIPILFDDFFFFAAPDGTTCARQVVSEKNFIKMFKDYVSSGGNLDTIYKLIKDIFEQE